MKELYLCEKCGKMHTSYNDAWECERSHITLDQVFSWDLPNGMTPDDYTAAMLQRQIADNPKEDENEEDEG